MTIRGQSLNVAQRGAPFPDLDPAENIYPLDTDVRNSRLTDALHWRRRPGYEEKFDSGINRRINLLIPESSGYAVHDNGQIYRLGFGTLTGSITGNARPSWTNHDGTVLVCAGGSLHSVSNTAVSSISGPPSGIRWLGVLNSRVIVAGHDATQFRWSDPGSHTIWDTANVTETETDGQIIQHFRVFKQRLYFFKDHSVEVWDNTGGPLVFTRSFVFQRGTLAPDSVIEANDTLYWFGDDGDFYVLNGAQPQQISTSIRRRLDELTVTTDCYALSFPAENVIRWFFPTNGRCFRYDYEKNHFSEDNAWRGGWERLPIASSMYLNGKTYVGDYEPTGKIYEWADEFDTDAGEDIRMYRRTALKLNETGNRARVNRVLFRLVRGEDADSPARSHFLFRWRFDRARTWRSRTFNLDRAVTPYVSQNNLGTGRELEFELIQTAGTKFIVADMAVTARALGA